MTVRSRATVILSTLVAMSAAGLAGYQLFRVPAGSRGPRDSAPGQADPGRAHPLSDDLIIERSIVDPRPRRANSARAQQDLSADTFSGQRTGLTATSPVPPEITIDPSLPAAVPTPFRPSAMTPRAASERLFAGLGNSGPENSGLENSGQAIFGEKGRPHAPAISGVPTNRPKLDPSSISDDQMIGLINRQLRQRWRQAAVTPSRLASDGTWCRRVYLDLLGRIPTVEELQDFLSDTPGDRRIRLVDSLLESDRYAAELADHWAEVWTLWLLGRGALPPKSPADRDALLDWLRTNFAEDQTYDQFVTDLVAGRGTNLPGEHDYLGAVNFLLDNLEGSDVAATNKVARIFLGRRIGCTQCHAHPFNSWQQHQFWGLNAFFKQTQIVQVRNPNERPLYRLLDRDFLGETGELDEAATFYELRDGRLKVAYPQFLDGTTINPDGRVSHVRRREQLAKLITQSPLMAEALINRFWAYFFGHGFSRPVDDLGPHNPPTHPKLLAKLAEGFWACGSQKRLMRWIVLSDPYQRSSKISQDNLDDQPDQGYPPLFSRFYLRQLPPESLYDSLKVAATQRVTPWHATGQGNQPSLPAWRAAARSTHRPRRKWVQQFAVAYDTEENDEVTTFSGTISQVLLLMNGELMDTATAVRPGTLLQELADAPLSAQQKIARLYLAALSRQPTPAETALGLRLWRARQGDAKATLQDIWWALLNSNEFVMNH